MLLLGDDTLIKSEQRTAPRLGAGDHEDHYFSDYYYSTPEDPTTTAHESNDVETARLEDRERTCSGLISQEEFALPWLAIGRIATQELGRTLDVVERIIAYESEPGRGAWWKRATYYKRMCLAAVFEDYFEDRVADARFIETMELVHYHLGLHGFAVDRVYTPGRSDFDEKEEMFYSDGEKVPSEVRKIMKRYRKGSKARKRLVKALRKGQLVIAHLGHGTWMGWESPPLSSEEIQEEFKEPPTRPTMMYSVNCTTAGRDLGGDGFGEVVLKHGVAPTVVAATHESHKQLNYSLIEALFDATWPGLVSTFPRSANGSESVETTVDGKPTVSFAAASNRLGDMVNYGKCYLPVRFDRAAALRRQLEIYHILGDPTLEVWKSQPYDVGLRAWITRDHLYVALTTCPAGSVVTVWEGDDPVRTVEPMSCHFRVPLSDSSRAPRDRAKREISVCFWAPGCRFQERVCFIEPDDYQNVRVCESRSATPQGREHLAQSS
jgi:hypothetical protein